MLIGQDATSQYPTCSPLSSPLLMVLMFSNVPTDLDFGNGAGVDTPHHCRFKRDSKQVGHFEQSFKLDARFACFTGLRLTSMPASSWRMYISNVSLGTYPMKCCSQVQSSSMQELIS